MNLNPFIGRNNIVCELADLAGRADQVNALWKQIREHRDVLLMGPEGIGKSSLLQCALSLDFRRQAAEEHHLLITSPFEYPTRLEGDRLFAFLVDELITAVRRVLDGAKGAELAEKIRLEVASHLEPSRMLKGVVDMLHDTAGYCSVLVIDNFERFTSSEEVTMAQHEIMRSLMEQGHLRFVVATNFDLSKDSLPPHVQGSFYLQKFFGCEMPLEGLSRNETKRYLTSLASPSFAALYRKLHELSGGIPRLMTICASKAYDLMMACNSTELTDEAWAQVQQYALEQFATYFKHWCSMLTDARRSVLMELVNGARSFADNGTAEALSKDRGLLRRDVTGRYSLISPLFAAYLQAHPLTGTGYDMSDFFGLHSSR